ncbi:04038f91-b1dc-4960-9b99-a7d978cda7fa [Thermothielavioides terrestris]|uniref:04038f91-b1dc-4960-9b99-a7d978cda7fa n=1 Tax=Thermothielavioides terrestris TaxID=2587410 RepID=A0A3S4F3N5_9PEZI|nr:04038f91-b1dc-4960-9b99-a7d978cda7fa [Thermothielavioides terrestris]
MPPQEMMANTTSVALPDDILEYPPPIRTRNLDAGPASPALKHASPGPAHSDSLHDTGDIHSEPEHGDNLNPPPPSDAFNIDDYLSSDADSVTTPSRRPTAEGEEELLFNEAGYGLGGMQLPGLPDSFPSPSSPAAAPRAKALRRGRSSPVLLKATLDPELVGAMCWDDSMGTRVARGVPPKKLGRVLEGREKRRFVLDTAADEEKRAGDQEMGGRVDDDDDDGYEADFVEDEEQTTSRRRTTKKRTRVLSALCSEKCAEEEQGQQQEGRQEQQQEELPPQRETADEKREAQTDVVAAI